jgi:CP family cyanate transporter-like MFS transporter
LTSQATATRWWAVAAAFGGGVAIALNVGKVPVALPTLRPELGLSLVQAGWVSSALTTMALLLAALVGMAVGRVGAWRMVMAGLLCCALGALLPLLLPAGFPGLLLGRLVEGFGFMCTAVATPALVTAATAAQDRRFALGLWSAYMPAGAGLAMLVSPLVLPWLGWQGLWVLSVAGLLMASAALWRFRAAYTPKGITTNQVSAAPPPAHTFWRTGLAALQQPLPWLLALAFGVWAIQHFALIVWMPTYLREVRGLSAGPTAVLTSVMLLACVPGNLMAGSLLQRGWSRSRLIILGQAGAGLGALLYASAALPDGLRYAAAVWVSFIGGVIPAAVMASSTVLARSPQQIGTLQGLFMQGAQLGQFVGTPSIAAVVAASGQWRDSWWVTLPSAALGILLGWLASRWEPAAHGTPPTAAAASAASAEAAEAASGSPSAS